jgi:hypothetical protein
MNNQSPQILLIFHKLTNFPFEEMSSAVVTQCTQCDAYMSGVCVSQYTDLRIVSFLYRAQFLL